MQSRIYTSPSLPFYSLSMWTVTTVLSMHSGIVFARTHFTMCSHHARSYIVKTMAPARTYNASKCAHYILLTSAGTYDTADRELCAPLYFLARLMRACALFTASTFTYVHCPCAQLHCHNLGTCTHIQCQQMSCTDATMRSQYCTQRLMK
jgi:hypothetical protein